MPGESQGESKVKREARWVAVQCSAVRPCAAHVGKDRTDACRGGADGLGGAGNDAGTLALLNVDLGASVGLQRRDYSPTLALRGTEHPYDAQISLGKDMLVCMCILWCCVLRGCQAMPHGVLPIGAALHWAAGSYNDGGDILAEFEGKRGLGRVTFGDNDRLWLGRGVLRLQGDFLPGSLHLLVLRLRVQ